jgi:hypothetical protein
MAHQFTDSVAKTWLSLHCIISAAGLPAGFVAHDIQAKYWIWWQPVFSHYVSTEYLWQLLQFRDNAGDYGLGRQFLRNNLLLPSSKFSRSICDMIYLYESQLSLKITGHLTEWILERRVLSTGFGWNCLGIVAKGGPLLKRSTTWTFVSLEFV